MDDKLITLRGILSLGDYGEGSDILFCGDIPVAQWAQDGIGGGEPVYSQVWDTRYMSKEEAERRTNECPTNKFISVRYWTADQPASDDAIKQRAIEMLYGAAKIDWGARYSEITGYLWTDEDFHIGGHDMIGRLSSEVGKYLLLEVIIHSGPRPA